MDDITRHAEDNPRRAPPRGGARARASRPRRSRSCMTGSPSATTARCSAHCSSAIASTAQEGVKRLLKKELKGLGAEGARCDRNVAGSACAALRAHPVPRPPDSCTTGPTARSKRSWGASSPPSPTELRAALDGAAGPGAPPARGRSHDVSPRQVALGHARLGACAHAILDGCGCSRAPADTTSSSRSSRPRATAPVGVPFAAIGPQGVFVREIEQALVEGRIDLAVHSFKDLPTTSPRELTIAAVPPRHDPADLLLVRPAAFAREPTRGCLLRRARASAQRRRAGACGLRTSVRTSSSSRCAATHRCGFASSTEGALRRHRARGGRRRPFAGGRSA